MQIKFLIDVKNLTWLFQAAEVTGNRDWGGKGSGQKELLANRPSTVTLGSSREEDLALRTSISPKRNPPSYGHLLSFKSLVFRFLPFHFPLANFNCPGRKGGCHVRKPSGGAGRSW